MSRDTNPRRTTVTDPLDLLDAFKDRVSYQHRCTVDRKPQRRDGRWLVMEDLRKQYTLDGLNDDEVFVDPFEQLRQWFKIAQDHVPAKWTEANTMTLATSSADGYVTARIVLLKGVDDRGLLFFTNYDSRKGRQLAENPCAAVVLFWPYLERQVRAEGTVERVSRESSKKYFHSRPRGSQIGAVISKQSQVLEDRRQLEQLAADLDAKLGSGEVPLPENWGGYRLLPSCFEFWQGRENRLHDRIRYRRLNDAWCRDRLAP